MEPTLNLRGLEKKVWETLEGEGIAVLVRDINTKGYLNYYRQKRKRNA